MKKAHERYQDLSEEEKVKKRQYGCAWYQNLPEDEIQRLAEYRKSIIKYGKIEQFYNEEWLIFFGYLPYARLFSDKYIKLFFRDFCFR